MPNNNNIDVNNNSAMTIPRGGTAAPTPSPTASKILSWDSLKEDPFIKTMAAVGGTIWNTSKGLALAFTHNILLYKPPVGIVTLIVTYQWLQKRVLQRNFLSVLDDFPVLVSHKKRRPKSVDVDAADRAYNTDGGVHAQALQEVLSRSSLNESVRKLVEDSACPPRTSRSLCAKRLVETMVEYQKQADTNNAQLQALLELRALDALLRSVRDEDLAPSANRLKSTKQAWEYDVGRWATSKRQWVKRTVLGAVMSRYAPSLSEWRKQLQQTSEKLQNEYHQLGQVQQLLLQQPPPPPPPTTKQSSSQQQSPIVATKAIMEWNENAKQLLKDFLTDRWSRVDPGKVVSEDDRPGITIGMDLQRLNQSSWGERNWLTTLFLVEKSQQRRRLLQEQQLREQAQLQVHGEGRYFLSWLTSWRFAELKSFVSRFDFFGIPSVVGKIVLAKVIHSALLPYWPQMKQTGEQVGLALWGIVEFRFYKPIKVIVMDLLNRRPRLLDSTQLDNEQESLLNMLRDLGIKVENMEKSDALAEASRMYEKQLRNGAVKNMVFGRMVQLILIQVQQLKADMLQAFKSIDELVDANRLNVSLLAAIPAFLLVRWGSQFIYTLLYQLRMHDVSGLKEAHFELTSLLRDLERLLILNKDQQQMSSEQLGEFIVSEQQYLLLLDYCQPPLPTKQVDSIYKDLQDLLPQGAGGLDKEMQLNLLNLIHQKNAELRKRI